MTAQAVGDVRTCPIDGEPVVFTFKFPGSEYYCPTCGWHGGVFAARSAPATPERVARAAEIQRQWEEQEGIKPEPDLPAKPVCGGCKAVAPEPRKPQHWYSRTKDGEEVYACSRKCIPSGEMIMPW